MIIDGLTNADGTIKDGIIEAADLAPGAIPEAVPVGTILADSVNVIPDGYFECDGAAIDRTLYADLFAKIGTTHGAGDGSTTFNLPDYRGEFLRGLDNGRGVDAGRAVGSAQADDIGSHRHQNYRRKHNGYAGSSAGFAGTWSAAANGSDYYPSEYEGGPETRPRNVAVTYLIKY